MNAIRLGSALGAAVVLATVFCISTRAAARLGGDTEMPAQVTKHGVCRVAGVADAEWSVGLSRPLADPQHNGQTVRVLALFAEVRLDNQNKVMRLSGLPTVATASSEPFTSSWLGFASRGDAPPEERETFRCWAVVAPVEGKSWADVTSSADLSVEIMGRAKN